jgi:Tol biopolymer transport system component
VTTLATGAIRTIDVPDTVGFHDEGDWSPDGKFLALLGRAESGERHMLWLTDLSTGRWVELVSDTLELSPPRWSSADNAIYFLTNQSELRKVNISDDGELLGMPQVLQTGLAASGLSITADGRKLGYIRDNRYANVWLAAGLRSSPRLATRQLTRGTAWNVGINLSPDRKSIALVRAEPAYGNVFVLDLAGGAPRQVTTSGTAFGFPAWSPDGRHLARSAPFRT